MKKRKIFRVVDGKKECTACGEIKPMTDFYRKYKDKPFPILGKCIICRRAERRGIPDMRKRVREHRKHCPIKEAARRRLRYAVKVGKIRKPNACEKCNERLEATQIQGHHHNGYDSPLDVEWLCKWCHAKEHWK